MREQRGLIHNSKTFINTVKLNKMVQTISIKKTVEVVETIEQEFPLYLIRDSGYDVLAFYSATSGQRIFKLNNNRNITNSYSGYQEFINKSDINNYKEITKSEYLAIFNECIELLQLENLESLAIAV